MPTRRERQQYIVAIQSYQIEFGQYFRLLYPGIMYTAQVRGARHRAGRQGIFRFHPAHPAIVYVWIRHVAWVVFVPPPLPRDLLPKLGAVACKWK